MTPPSPVFSVGSAQVAGELLTLQRAAHVSEAQLYGDVALPALTQTLPDLVAELAGSIVLKATADGRLVGAVRARVDGELMHIGRLALFTGHPSLANLRLYEREGYVETRRDTLRPGVELVHLQKAVQRTPDGVRRPGGH